MTNKEKIMKLQTYKMYEDEVTVYVERDDVLKALEQIELNPSEDAIGMDAVIEWLKNKDIIKLSSQEEIARKELKELLSVTPRRDPAETSQDCISREEAIRVAEQGQIQGFEWQLKKLCTLPSVTPKPKIGHWIEDEYEMMVWCSECCEENDICSKYCPNCGAKMTESEE